MSAKDKTGEQLSAYLDGELSDADSQRLALAVEADEALQGELAELAATRDLLRALPIEHAPDDLVNRVLAEAERSQLVGTTQSDTLPGSFRWVRYSATAAVLLVAASLGAIVAVTLWSPPGPNYETHLAREPAGPAAAGRSSRGRAEGVSADANGRAARKLGETTVLAGTRGLGLKGHDRLEHAKAKGGSGHAFVKDVGNLLAQVESNEIIFTDQMALTLREVETVLRANGIEPMVAEVPDKKLQKGPEALARGNVYRESQRSVKQVQYEAWVTPEQMPKVQKRIRSIRAEQEVSQVALAPGADRPGWGKITAGRFREKGSGTDQGKAEKKSTDETVLGDVSETLQDTRGLAGKSRYGRIAPGAPSPEATPKPKVDASKEAMGDEDGQDEVDGDTLTKRFFGTGTAKAPRPASRPTRPATPAPLTAGKRLPRSLPSGLALGRSATRPTPTEAKPSKVETLGGAAITRAPVRAQTQVVKGYMASKSAAGGAGGRSGVPGGAPGPAKSQADAKTRGESTFDVADTAGERPGPVISRGVQTLSGTAERPAAKPTASKPASGKSAPKLAVVKNEGGFAFAEKAGRQVAATGRATGQATGQAMSRMGYSVQAGSLTQPAATRPISVTVTTQPATQAAVEARYGQAPLTGQREHAQEKLTSIPLRQVAPAQRRGGDFRLREMTSQRATARLQRLLITVNFRSPSGPADRAASVEARAKEAPAKR